MVDNVSVPVNDQADSLRALLGSRRQTDPKLRVIAVTSGKGGVGKSTVTANLAVLHAQAGRRVLIIDADLGLANIEILFGVTPRYNISHILDETVPIDEVLARGPHGIRILSSGSGIQALTRLTEMQRHQLLRSLDPLENWFDVVLIDSGAGIGDNVLFFVGAAHEIVLVVTPEPTSITDAYATMKVLCQQSGVKSFQVLVNSAQSDNEARDIFQRLTRVSSKFLKAKVNYAGYVPRDPNAHKAIMAQRPLVELYPASAASLALAAFANSLLNVPNSSELDGGLKFLWQRLLRESGTQEASASK